MTVPRSELTGFELDAGWRPIAGLTITPSFSYIDSKIDQYTGYNASGNLVNFQGAVLPYTPRYQVRAAADYKWSLGHLTPFVGATVSYQSSQYANIGGSRGFVTPANFRSDYPVSELFLIKDYTLVDLRVGIASDRDGWTVSLFGKNVANTYYTTNILTSYDAVARYAGYPSTWGITLAWKH